MYAIRLNIYGESDYVKLVLLSILMMITRKSPHFNGEMDRAYLLFVRYKPDQKYTY